VVCEVVWSLVFLRSVLRSLVTANVVPSSPILATLMMEAILRFLQEPHGVTSPKTVFLTGVNTASEAGVSVDTTSALYHYLRSRDMLNISVHSATV
jgi:hypothetical protein